MYAWIAFFGAFLLFFVQPLLGKAVTPRFGGGLHVWMTCLLYFQSALLLGYAYAHGLATRCSRRAQGRLHGGLLALALLQLAFTWQRAGAPLLPTAGGGLGSAALLVELVRVSGLPLLALCATAPLVQSWFAADQPGLGPYRLYAASNIGSLLGLLAFPFATERWFSTSMQAKGLCLLFAVFSGWILRLAFLGETEAPRVSEGLEASEPLGWKGPGRWLLASSVGVVLLMAATNFLTQAIAAIPLLWVLPLVAYLLTFILIFDGRWPLDKFLQPGWPALGAAAAFGLSWWGAKEHNNWLLIPSVVVCTFCGGLSAHGFLHAEKPGPHRLTQYYLFLSLGGVLGGGLVALAAPRLFARNYEMGLALIAVGAVAILWASDGDGSRVRKAILPLPLLAAGVAAVGLEMGQPGQYFRDYFGILRVTQEGAYRTLQHGGIVHGIVDLAHPDVPLTYYGRNSGVGRALAIERERKGSLRVGVVGLGAGTLAVYAQPGDDFTFYEISPLVIRLSGPAEPLAFPLLSQCRGKVEVVLGDARTEMERELREAKARRYDVLLVDAFSGGSIPWHLLTVESMQVYLRHLAPDGILAFNVSNNLPIYRVGITNAKALDLYGARLVLPADEGVAGGHQTNYLLFTRAPEVLRNQRILGASGEGFGPRTFRERPGTVSLLRSGQPWRDDRAALSGLLFEPQ